MSFAVLNLDDDTVDPEEIRASDQTKAKEEALKQEQVQQNDRVLINGDDDIQDVKEDGGDSSDIIMDDATAAPPSSTLGEPLKIDVTNELNITLSTPFDAPATTETSTKEEVVTASEQLYLQAT